MKLNSVYTFPSNVYVFIVSAILCSEQNYLLCLKSVIADHKEGGMKVKEYGRSANFRVFLCQTPAFWISWFLS
jgi:hypothetical protein